MKRSQKRQKPKRRSQNHPPQPKTTAIVAVPPAPPVVQSIIPKVKAAVENLERVRRFVSQCLNVDLQIAERKAKELGKVLDEDTRSRLEVDWGTIPGVDKPFLMQPGAEKVLHWLQLRPKFITRETDLGNGHLEVVSHVVIYSKLTHEEVFEGPDASCSTMETNYRYIWAESDTNPPDEEKARLKAIGMGKNRKLPVWARGKKVGERWAWFVRVDNPNIWNERNKVRQIGEKRGLVKGVKQMGALSAIFNADPSEWQFTTDEEESPENEMDYTEGGRLIVGPSGLTPSGRATTESQAEQAKKNQAEIIRQKTNPEDKPHGHAPGSPRAAEAEATLARVEAEDRRIKEQQKASQQPPEAAKPPIDVTPQPAKPSAPALPTLEAEALGPDSFIIRGDIEQAYAMIDFHCKFLDGWWRCNLAALQTIQSLQQRFGFKITVIAAAKPATPPTVAAKPKKEAVPPTLVKGTLSGVKDGKTSKGATVLSVKIGNTVYPCFSKTLNPILQSCMAGTSCEIWIDDRHTIVGLKRLGTVEYDTDGRTPIVQRHEQVAGQKTFFGA